MRRNIFREVMEGFKWLEPERQGKAKGGRVTEVAMFSPNAKGLRGILCRSLEGRYFLRVPMGKDKFIDMGLAHSDLDIEILASDSAIYRFNDEYVLDHAPETLRRRVKPAQSRKRRKALTGPGLQRTIQLLPRWLRLSGAGPLRRPQLFGLRQCPAHLANHSPP